MPQNCQKFCNPRLRCRFKPGSLIKILKLTVHLSRSTAQQERTARMSYVSRALALARPTSPPPAYRSDSQPSVLTLRSYFNFAQVSVFKNVSRYFKVIC